MDKIVVARENMTLDLLLFRRFGPDGQQLVESVLNANAGLADLGAILPIGTVVRVPEEMPAPVPPAQRAVVDLFG